MFKEQPLVNDLRYVELERRALLTEKKGLRKEKQNYYEAPAFNYTKLYDERDEDKPLLPEETEILKIIEKEFDIMQKKKYSLRAFPERFWQYFEQLKKRRDRYGEEKNIEQSEDRQRLVSDQLEKYRTKQKEIKPSTILNFKMESKPSRG